ncbi:hypothetical protein M407DRAFT_33072 [Tulasnella calospora MUT 4182]|uniref:F-box domain-containing protein n=1 Tax=Tulasnella calospora MUT 4182 TaxID=1051891 RepID=A0A0C3L6V5_9AGAM|nr:hypothetical protein M407DRAFT_33072 [Tulasnella calospora MUT 4182]
MPRPDVVSQAIATIVEGVCKENDFDIQYSGVESTYGLPVRRLPTFWDALKAAKARMNQQMDQLIAHFIHRWNRASSIHRLPVEVLAIIFQEFEPSPPHPDGDSSLFDLLLVCRTWYDAITGSPQLWRFFGAHTPYNIARLIVDRSKALPISVDWRPPISADWHLPAEPPKWDLGKVLDLAIENSTRIKSLTADVPWMGNRHLWNLLQAPTPVLETLQVDVPVTNPNVLYEFVLSEGPYLKHLSLLNATTPFDSPRLSNLISLTLRESSWPRSFEDFLRVLSSSQRLETLRIEDVARGTGEVQANASVVLPQLRELVLSDVSSVYVAAILASIYTPSCTHVEVADDVRSEQDSEAVAALDAVIWHPGNDQAAVLVGRKGPNIIPGLLSIQIQFYWITITIGSLESSQGHRKLQFARPNVPQILARLGTTFSQLSSPPAVHLHRMTTHIERRSPVDLLPWSELLDSLLMEGSQACRSVLRQLSRRHGLPGTGGGDWVCRRLSSIKLVYGPRDEEDAALDGGALLSLVRQRWSDEDGFPGAARPAVFEVACNKANFPNLWSLEGEVMRILPSFQLRAMYD